jgi:RNA polymerase sigma factor (sigma-70 family)
LIALATQPSGTPPFTGPNRGWEDAELVGACLSGDEQAWNALVDKYKNLMCAIALRYGAQPADAADIFQAVWIDACAELKRLRKRGSVRSWLMTITRNKCYHWKQKERSLARRLKGENDDIESDPALAVDPVALEDLEQDQLVRDAVSSLPGRCRELVGMLFFEEPPRPYKEVARVLGLAVGSIGFIRGRCLEKLRKALRQRNVG